MQVRAPRVEEVSSVEASLRLDAVASAVLAGSRWVSHVAINRADSEVLERHFPGLGGWLPNLVERPAPPGAGQRQAAAAWLNQQLGEAAPVWLLPCRLLRRARRVGPRDVAMASCAAPHFAAAFANAVSTMPVVSRLGRISGSPPLAG